MAYSVSIVEKCSEKGCEKQATEEVRNGANAVIRRCCAKHAALLVKRLNMAGG